MFQECNSNFDVCMPWIVKRNATLPFPTPYKFIVKKYISQVVASWFSKKIVITGGLIELDKKFVQYNELIGEKLND